MVGRAVSPNWRVTVQKKNADPAETRILGNIPGSCFYHP